MLIPAIRAIGYLRLCADDGENLQLYLSAQALIKPFAARLHPWRCLCRGFGQMTRTTPLRRTILHLRQILFTDAITFICHLHGARAVVELPGAKRDAPLRQAAGRHLDIFLRHAAFSAR